VPVSPIRDLNPAVSLKAAIAASKAAPLAADFVYSPFSLKKLPIVSFF
jgi:hypothetical protein